MKSGEFGDAKVLAVDVGSSSVRAELYDASGVGGTETKLDYDLEYAADEGKEDRVEF